MVWNMERPRMGRGYWFPVNRFSASNRGSTHSA